MAVPLIALTIIAHLFIIDTQAAYLGKFLGKLTELHHGVSGEVYAVDARTLHIKDFTYDGQGPAAYFFAGSSRAPGNSGFRIRDENGSPEVLRRYRKEGVTITLPEGKSLNNIKWFSVWCEEFEVNFGDVKIPKNFDYPRPQKIDALRGVHGVSSDNIVIVDAQTLLIPNLSYDGEAPDAKFWVGRGSKPTPQGIRVPDENGKEIPLRRYDHKTVVLTLPGDLTVFDIGHFGIWCEAFTVDFGHVQIQPQLNVPPSLKMLGVSPQSKLNCEVLHDDLAFEVRWAIAGDSIVLQLVAKLENREYMAFGISGDEGKSAMIGGDVVVAWVDKETLKGYAEDYYLDAKSQCSGPSGSCPDLKLAENTNNIRLLNAAMVNGYSIVTYQRPLKPSDQYDKQIVTNTSQPVIWAIGPLNQRNEVSFHSQYNKQDKFIDFGRAAKWNCPMPEGDQPSMKPVAQKATITTTTTTEEIEEEIEVPKTTTARTRNNERRRGGSSPTRQQDVKDSEKSATRTRTNERRGSARPTRPVPTPAPVKNRNAWEIPPIQCYEPEDGVFYAQMGPTGGKRGYPAITGHVGWGISWYINGLLIPEINVVRGKTYTFVVEGGYDPEVPAKYHPFYITDDPIGGYEHKTNEEKQSVRIFAGARQSKDGSVHPTGVGRLCHWTHQGDSDADDFESFGAYQRSLELKCDQGEPGVIQWTPDKDTPDTVYYQCFTHRYLGWKINVHDSCDQAGAASEIKETIVEPDAPKDLTESPSILVETRVKPNDINIDELVKELVTEKTSSKLASDENTQYAPQELPDFDSKYVFKPPDDIGNILLLKPNISYMPFPQKPYLMSPPKVILRRPPTSNVRPYITKPHSLKPQIMHHRPPPMMMKKPYYRPMIKIPAPPRPILMSTMHQPIKLEKPMMRPHTIFMKPQRPKPIILIPAESKLPEPHVEVSKPQASTEREPGTAYTEKHVVTRPAPPVRQYEAMKPAVNTGFNPASVVIESGFKPIITKDIERRMADNDDEQVDEESNSEGPEIEIESEAGVIDESRAEDTQKATQFFEPIFIPSPTIDVQAKKMRKMKKTPVMFIIKQGRRSIHDEEIPAANERVEAYYLPPDNDKSKPIERPRQRSNIDLPPGTVITYDGRKVSGASLTPRADQRSVLDARSSKASEFIRARPQFVPFKGELPPLDLANSPQFQATRVLSRELGTPLQQQSGGSALKLVRQYDDNEQHHRRKRAAHHTEEHTAQQERERMEHEQHQHEHDGHDGHDHHDHHDHHHAASSSSNVQTTLFAFLILLILHHLIKLYY